MVNQAALSLIGGVAFFYALILAPPGQAANELQVRVAGVEHGLSIVLENGQKLRLSHLHVPKSLVDEAEETLLEIVSAGRLVLVRGDRKKDRYGRIPARLQTEKGRWLDEALLEKGLAVFLGNIGDAGVAARLWAAEKMARTAKRGVWEQGTFGPTASDRASIHIGGFALIEGRVLKTAAVKGRVYLNFGENWRTDFTVSAKKSAYELITNEGLLVGNISGRLVRARGWVESRNGPMITLRYPGQLELIE